MHDHPVACSSTGTTLARWAKNCLATIGALSIIVHGGSYLIHHLASDEVGVEIPSPDGKYKAVLFKEYGGAAGAGYCYDAISVVAAGGKVDSNDESQRVYLAGCHSLVDPLTNNHTNGPEIKWLANNRLQIRFSANQGARGVSQLILKGFAASGQIYMAYVVSESSL